MKYNRIITITLSNGLALLVFASLLASCQKKSIKTTGHFTNKFKAGRFPASFDPIDDLFDPKQIFIYCKINSINNEQCFKQHFNEKLHELSKSNKISVTKAQSFNYLDYFSKSQVDVAVITKKILNNLEDKIYSHSKKKEKLCDDNKVIYLKQCLNNSIDADSVHILNTYQQSHPEINGQEYIYLKNQIKISLTNKLNDVFSKIQNKQTSSLIKQFSEKYGNLKRTLDKDKEWISSSISLPMAIDSCVQKVNSEISGQKEFARKGINLKDFIKEYFCLDYVNSPEVMKVVNYKYNLYFEKRLSILFEIIRVSAPEVLKECIGSSKRTSVLLNNCLENNWKRIVDISYERWLNEGENKDFINEKDIIFKRTNNIAPKLKREIASSIQ